MNCLPLFLILFGFSLADVWLPGPYTCLTTLGVTQATANFSVSYINPFYYLNLEIPGRFNGTIDNFYNDYESGSDPIYDITNAQFYWATVICAAHTTTSHYVVPPSNLNSTLPFMVTCNKFNVGANISLWVNRNDLFAQVHQTGDNTLPLILAQVSTSYESSWKASILQLYSTWVYTLCNGDLAGSGFGVTQAPFTSFVCTNTIGGVGILANYSIERTSTYHWSIIGNTPGRYVGAVGFVDPGTTNQDPLFVSQDLLMRLPRTICTNTNNMQFIPAQTSQYSPLPVWAVCDYQGIPGVGIMIYVSYSADKRFYEVKTNRSGAVLPPVMAYSYIYTPGQDGLANIEGQYYYWLDLLCSTDWAAIGYRNSTVNNTVLLSYEIECDLGNGGIGPLVIRLIQGALVLPATESTSDNLFFNMWFRNYTAPTIFSDFLTARLYSNVMAQDQILNLQSLMQRVMFMQCGALGGPILIIPGTFYPTVTPGSCSYCSAVFNGAGAATNFFSNTPVTTFNTRTGDIITQGTANQIIKTESPTKTFTDSLSPTLVAPGSVSIGAVSGGALLLTSTAGTVNGGIIWGVDTNLYRSAANTLMTDDNFVCPALTLNGVTYTGMVSSFNTRIGSIVTQGTSNQIIKTESPTNTFTDSISSTFVFPGTVTATAGSVTISAGGSSNRILGTKLHENPSVMDYGAVGDCTTDDSVAIQAGITALAVSGGGHLYFPPACYAVATTITITSSSITLYGDGSPDWISSSSVAGKTIWKWTGGASVMLKVAPVAGAGNDPLQGVKVDRIGFLCQGVATYGVEIASSWMGWFNIYAEQCLTALVWTHVITPLAVNGGMQQNNLWIYGKQTTSGGDGIYSDGNIAASPVATDTAFNFFHMVDIELGLGSNGIVLAFTDHNYFAMAAFPALGSSTGRAIWFKGGASLSEASHGNIIQFLSASIPYVYAEGTELGQAFASYGNIVYRYNIGATLPTIGTGATFQWGDDTGTAFGPNNLFTVVIADSVGLSRSAAILINGQSLYVANGASNHITLTNSGETKRWDINVQTSTGNLRLTPGTGANIVVIGSGLQLSVAGTTNANGIIFGSAGDTTIYRSAANRAQIDGTFAAQHYICTGGTPTVACGAGAGGVGVGTCSTTGTDCGGTLTIVVAGSPTGANAVICTTTFGLAFPNNLDSIGVTAAGVASGNLTPIAVTGTAPHVGTMSTTAWNLNSGPTALPVGTYVWTWTSRTS